MAARVLVAALALSVAGALTSEGARAPAEAEGPPVAGTAGPSGEPSSLEADATSAAGSKDSEPDTTVAPGEARNAGPAQRAESPAAAPEKRPEALAPAPSPAKPSDAPPAAKAPRASAAAKPANPQANPAKARPRVAAPESERVGREVDRTERGITRARRSVIISKDTRAQKLFASALDFQSDARVAYKVHQFARAERLTMAARDYADRAARMVGPPREDPEYVEHVLERTEDAIDRAKDVLKNGAGQDAWKRHDDLKRSQKEAWKSLKGGDVGRAYKQTLAVREGVLNLLRQIPDLPVPRAAAEKAIGGAQVALEQASKELGPKPNREATRLVRLANEYLEKARDSFNRKSYRSALLQAKVVERHLERAVDAGRPRG